MSTSVAEQLWNKMRLAAACASPGAPRPARLWHKMAPRCCERVTGEGGSGG